MILTRFLPFLRWFPPRPGQLRADILAGLALGLLLIPQGLAYAALAGMPPVTGLYAAIIPTIIGALFGSCGSLNTGPVAMTSMLTMAAVGRHVTGGGSDYIALVGMLAIEVGICRLLLGLARGSWIVNFLSQPALAGFTIAAAVIIGAAQLADMLGLSVERSGHVIPDLWLIVSSVSSIHVAGCLMGVISLLALVGLKRVISWAPPALIVCTGTLMWSWFMQYDGAVVGEIPSGLPYISFPHAPWQAALALIPDALWVTMIGFMEVLAVSRVAANKTRQVTDLNQELVGQGLASIGAGLCGGFPVSGSVNRSTFNLHNGARTGMSSVVAALLVLAALVFLGDVLARLPRATLGATVIASVLPLLTLRPLFRAWKAHPHDGAVVLVTLLATIILSPNMVDGILIGGGLALCLHLHRTRKPHVCELGLHEDGTLRDRERHGLAELDLDSVFLRFDGRLYFANAAHFEQAVSGALARHPKCQWIAVVADGINEIDATGVEMLRELILRLRESGVGLVFIGVKATVEETLVRTEIQADLGESAFFRTYEAALAYIQQQRTPTPPVAPTPEQLPN